MFSLSVTLHLFTSPSHCWWTFCSCRPRRLGSGMVKKELFHVRRKLLTFSRASNRYRNSLLNVPVRRNRINVASVPRTTYYPSEYDLDRGSLPYSRSRSAVGDSAMSQELLLSRGRETTRLNSRSTVAPNADDKLTNKK